jgi:ElaB/YqjD/DUF883 family membrane-anchored ribosome-binding protein
MGQSTDELRRDIERTRGELGETMDAIGDRVSPSRIVERRRQRAVATLRSVRDRVMGTADEVSDDIAKAADKVGEVPSMLRRRTQGAPVMAGAVAFGVGFVVAAAFPATETERDVSEKLIDKAEPLKNELTSTTKEIAEHLREPARDAAEQVRDTAMDSAESVKETAASAAGRTEPEPFEPPSIPR